jgi:hypothetical protein
MPHNQTCSRRLPIRWLWESNGRTFLETVARRKKKRRTQIYSVFSVLSVMNAIELLDYDFGDSNVIEPVEYPNHDDVLVAE